MLEKYKTVYEGGEGEIVEKKSRFIATVRPVQTEEEALAFIEEMKKKYWDARHNCYVYSVGKNREYTRCSDDGEPSGTAGRPMLDVILGEDIYNVAAVVTRYFGGILLGTGGLVRAYSRSLQEGLAAIRIIGKLLVKTNMVEELFHNTLHGKEITTAIAAQNQLYALLRKLGQRQSLRQVGVRQLV